MSFNIEYSFHTITNSFYKIINNLAQVPNEHILRKAYEGTRKKNNHKFRHIAVNTSLYRQSFFPKTAIDAYQGHLFHT